MHCLPLDAQMNDLECVQSENFKNETIKKVIQSESNQV